RKNGVRARPVEPNGSGPSPPAQPSGRSPWGPATRVVPRVTPVPGNPASRQRRALVPSTHRYPNVPSQPDLPALEREILERWARGDTFRRSVEARDAGPNGANEFVFYDGPPFANGLPHYGHLLTGFVKDVVPRYQTMKGRRVERRFGWDCHGLPVEMEVEKELRVRGRGAV